jgi:uridine nucleosidase
VQARILGSGRPTGPPSPSVLRQILHALLTFFAGTYKTVFGIDSGPPLHDPLAVAVILSNLNPSFAKSHPDKAIRFDDMGGERFAVTVVTDGHHGKDVSITGQLGRTIVKPMEGRGIAIPRGVDTDAFWDLVVYCVERAEQFKARNQG